MKKLTTTERVLPTLISLASSAIFFGVAKIIENKAIKKAEETDDVPSFVSTVASIAFTSAGASLLAIYVPYWIKKGIETEYLITPDDIVTTVID